MNLHFISNWNQVNLSSNKIVIPKTVIVGLGSKSKLALSYRLFLNIFDTSFQIIFKTCFYWRYPYEYNLIWLWKHSN
jgi:hypothetical protein